MPSRATARPDPASHHAEPPRDIRLLAPPRECRASHTHILAPGSSMHSRSVRLGAVVIALATPLTAGGAQDDAGAEGSATAVNADARAMLGVTVSISGTGRDTLGVLVTSVVPDGPADRVRIARGNRIAEIEGVSLRVRASEVGQRRAAEAVRQRLARVRRAAQ